MTDRGRRSGTGVSASLRQAKSSHLMLEFMVRVPLSIGRLAFSGCGNLTRLNVGNSASSIGDWAFHFCASQTSAYFLRHVPHIKSWGKGVLHLRGGFREIQRGVCARAAGEGLGCRIEVSSSSCTGSLGEFALPRG